MFRNIMELFLAGWDASPSVAQPPRRLPARLLAAGRRRIDWLGRCSKLDASQRPLQFDARRAPEGAG